MIWRGYPVLRYLCLAGLLAGLHVAALAWLLPRRAKPRRTVRWPLPIASARFAALVTVLIIAARGGIRGIPLNWGGAVHCDVPFANHLAENSVWALGKAIKDNWRAPDRLDSMWNSSLPLAQALVRTEELLRRDEQPAAVKSQPVVLRETDRPPNIVVIL